MLCDIILLTNMDYYTSIIVLVWLSLLVLTILVIENNRLKKNQKIVLYFTYGLVTLSTLAEWLGVKFNGNPDIPLWVIRMIKFIDYVLTPACGGAIVLQFRRNGVIQRMILAILLMNLVFQVAGLFTDLMIIFDTNHAYKHGKLYFFYIAVYFLIILLTIIEFGVYGKRYRKHNLVSLFSILILVVAGILFQELFNNPSNMVRTAYISIVIGLTLLFIHHNEFAQQEADEQIHEQMIQITIDPLTGILNRYAYEEALRETTINDEFVVFSIDINGLKVTNDTYGHKAGDELISGAANIISETFSEYGKCFRIGGDEFIVLTYIDVKKIDKVLKVLEKRIVEWKGVEVPHLSLSMGYATAKEFDLPSINDLVSEADQRMYKNKTAYYLAIGIDRRRQ